jgi:hypothetical protein
MEKKPEIAMAAEASIAPKVAALAPEPVMA